MIIDCVENRRQQKVSVTFEERRSFEKWFKTIKQGKKILECMMPNKKIQTKIYDFPGESWVDYVFAKDKRLDMNRFEEEIKYAFEHNKFTVSIKRK